MTAVTTDLKWGFLLAVLIHVVLLAGDYAWKRPVYEVTVSPSSLEVSLVKSAAEERVSQQVKTGGEDPKLKKESQQKKGPSQKAEKVLNPLRGAFRAAKPQVHVNKPPHYPRVARQKGYEGQVVLRVHVDSQGRATSVRVIHSSGHPLLDEVARKAILRWRFDPARRFGQPVASTVQIPVVFRLEERW